MAAAAVSALVALAAWALSSPVGATPDEDFHLASTWCGLGERADACAPGSSEATREVPREILLATCFAFRADVSASCQASVVDPDELVETKRGNFTGLYPPVFFAVTSAFVGDDVNRSVLVMRMFNASLFVLLVGAVVLLSPAGLRRAVLVGAVVTSVPFTVFLVPSINPSGWAFLSAVTLLVSVVGYLTTRGRRRWALGALSVVATTVGAGARADAAVYAIIAIAIAMFLTVRRERAWWLAAVLPVALALASAVSYLTAGQNNATENVGDPLTLQRLWDLLLGIPHLWVGTMGLWGLGWLDTALPPVVWAVNWGLYVAVVFAALVRLPRRVAWSVAGMATAVVAIPSYVQYASGEPVGSMIQPRYILPLLTMLAIVAVLRLDGPAFVLAPVQRWLLVAGLGVTNAVSLHANMRRYVTGTDVATLDLDNRIEWWWGGLPIGPLATFVLGAVAFVVMLAVVTGELARPADAGELLTRARAAVRDGSTSPDTEADDRSAPDGGTRNDPPADLAVANGSPAGGSLSGAVA